MAKIDASLFDLSTLDTLASRQSPIHRLDPRAKVITTLVFILVVASFGKYQVAALLPMLIFPGAMIAVGNLPLGYLSKKLLLVAPFAVLIGILNPVFDREILLTLGPVAVSGGWISLASIVLRFVLSLGAALILIASTSFPAICRALEQLGTPRVFVIQLLFLYRYIFVLADEGVRLARARALRSFEGRGHEWRVFGSMAGQLLMRALDRAERVHLAMRCRGFDGVVRTLHPGRFGKREVLFVTGWCSLFLLFRLTHFPQLLGQLFLELNG